MDEVNLPVIWNAVAPELFGKLLWIFPAAASTPNVAPWNIQENVYLYVAPILRHSDNVKTIRLIVLLPILVNDSAVAKYIRIFLLCRWPSRLGTKSDMSSAN